MPFSVGGSFLSYLYVLEYRFDIRRRRFQAVHRALDFRANHSKFGQHFLGRGVVALSFDCEEIVVERSDGILDFAEVDSERAVRIQHKGCFVAQVIELNGHASGVRVLQAKTKSAEGRREIGRIKLAFRRGTVRERSLNPPLIRLIYQELQSEQTGNIRFGFLDRTVEFL